MKNQLAAIELKVLVQEFKQLEGAWLEKVYDAAVGAAVKAGKGIVLQLGKSEGIKRFLACLSPFAVFCTAAKPAVSEGPGGFCSFLRHHLGNARLASIRQLGFERILELVFSSGNNRLRLMIELFSKGNVLLLDEAGIIIGAAEQQQWKDRTIRPGFAYQPPPATPDFAALPLEQFSKIVLSSEKDSVVKALAVDIGLSGIYAEELCAAAGIDKSRPPTSLSGQDLAAVFSSLQGLLSRKPAPIALLDDKGRISEVFPFPILASAAARTRPCQSFSEAVEALSLQQAESSSLSSKESPFARKVKELEIAIGQQRSAIDGMSTAVDENTRAAELVYEHYLEVRQILEDYGRLRKSFTKEQIKEYFKSNKKVVSIDEKDGTITVELVSAH